MTPTPATILQLALLPVPSNYRVPEDLPLVVRTEPAAFALSLVRQLPAFEAFIRAGRWRSEEAALTHSVKGRRLGIFGLGRIGLAISKRAAPFGFILGYHNRSARQDVAARPSMNRRYWRL